MQTDLPENSFLSLPEVWIQGILPWLSDRELLNFSQANSLCYKIFATYLKPFIPETATADRVSIDPNKYQLVTAAQTQYATANRKVVKLTAALLPDVPFQITIMKGIKGGEIDPLEEAIKSKDLATLREMFAAGLKFPEQEDKDYLLIALKHRFNDLDVIELLLKQGMVVEAKHILFVLQQGANINELSNLLFANMNRTKAAYILSEATMMTQDGGALDFLLQLSKELKKRK